jgi:hypothetical protein
MIDGQDGRPGCRWGTMSVMATPPESTKISVGQRLRAHAAAHWPQAGKLEFRYRGAFVYVEPARRHDAAVDPAALRRLGQSLGLRALPGQQRPL